MLTRKSRPIPANPPVNSEQRGIEVAFWGALYSGVQVGIQCDELRTQGGMVKQ